jgi:hypothetical protein
VGTSQNAIAMHRYEDIRKKHEGMGFRQDWGQVFDQLIEHVKSGR